MLIIELTNNRFVYMGDHNELVKLMKLADKPGSVVDSHSSSCTVTCALKQPTRRLREPHHCLPIWSCSGWRLPRFTVTEYARLCGPVPHLTVDGC